MSKENLKKIIIINIIGVIVFSTSFIIGKVGIFDFRYLGIIFTGCAWSYSIGVFVLDKREKRANNHNM